MPVGAALVILGAVAYGISTLPSWFAHPIATQVCYASYHTPAAVRDCKSYNLWSGIGSDLSELTIIIGMITFAFGWWHQHNCHIEHCPRLQWHPHPDHGHPVCKRHHPHEVTEDGVNAAT